MRWRPLIIAAIGLGTASWWRRLDSFDGLFAVLTATYATPGLVGVTMKKRAQIVLTAIWLVCSVVGLVVVSISRGVELPGILGMVLLGALLLVPSFAACALGITSDGAAQRYAVAYSLTLAAMSISEAPESLSGDTGLWFVGGMFFLPMLAALVAAIVTFGFELRARRIMGQR